MRSKLDFHLGEHATDCDDGQVIVLTRVMARVTREERSQLDRLDHFS